MAATTPSTRQELAEVELAAGVTPGQAIRAGGRPVLLATLGVPFDGRASEVAVDAAVESGLPLVIVNAVELPPLGMSVAMGYDQLPEADADSEAYSAPAALARSLGVEVERWRVRSPRPVEALLEVAAEVAPGLLVFGPDRSRIKGRLFRKAAKAIRDRVNCLVWFA